MNPNSRHEQNCKICNHPHREEIEEEFCEWKSVVAISREYRVNRVALYRHARAVGLFGRRDRNIKAALGRLIERGYQVRVTAAAVISAIQAYAKINAAGEWIDKTENVNVNTARELFHRMTREEMLRYAETGELPSWWPADTSRRLSENISDSKEEGKRQLERDTFKIGDWINGIQGCRPSLTRGSGQAANNFC